MHIVFVLIIIIIVVFKTVIFREVTCVHCLHVVSWKFSIITLRHPVMWPDRRVTCFRFCLYLKREKYEKKQVTNCNKIVKKGVQIFH